MKQEGALRAILSESMFCISHSAPSETSLGRRAGDEKAYGQFTDNVKLINEL